MPTGLIADKSNLVQVMNGLVPPGTIIWTNVGTQSMSQYGATG